MKPMLLVTTSVSPGNREVIAQTVGSAGDVVYLADVAPEDRAATLSAATVVLSHNTVKEFSPGETDLLANAKLIQFVSAGVDFVPLADLPPNLPVASNGGAYAEPMAEHALAMALAAFKRLFIEHGKLQQGEFNQRTRNRMLRGSVCGILGFGGIGVATARLMSALGVEVYATNRSGRTDEPVAWIGTTAEQDHIFQEADIIVLSLPLTPATVGLIGRRELELMKPDAVLINLARGEIVDEAALYEHLVANPSFTACIDAWWIEPVRHDRFDTGEFLNLPNVIGSPHNSASVVGWSRTSIARATANARRALEGQEPRFLVPAADRMM